MSLVRRSNGRRRHWTSLTASVSKAALSKALDVRAELNGIHPGGEILAGTDVLFKRAGQAGRNSVRLLD